MMDAEGPESFSGEERQYALLDGAEAEIAKAYSLGIEAGMTEPTVVVIDLGSPLAHQMRDAMIEEGAVGQQSTVVNYADEPVPVEALAVPSAVAEAISPADFERFGPLGEGLIRTVVFSAGAALISSQEFVPTDGPTRPLRPRRFSRPA